MDHPSQLVRCFSVYYPNFSSRWKERDGTLLQDLRARTSGEQFSGKGHKIHVCKRCQAKPKSQRRAIENKDDISGFLKQSRISEKNVARLEQMAKSDDPQVANLAAIVLEVARVKPHKTRRLRFLAERHPELLGKLRDTNLILAHDG